ncbi:MAG: DUF2953 domain-containing protein [Clostridia bacterium]|nr:DUF2953 domain-containing protein [Clostridia bacterium]
MTAWIIAGIIIFILAIVLFIPLGIGARYEEGVFVIVKIAFFSVKQPFEMKPKDKGGEKKKKKEKKPKEEKEPGKELERGAVGLDFILELLGDFRRFVRKKIALEDFELTIEIGTSDAAATAIGTGALWGLSYNLLALLDKLVEVKEPKIDIKPSYNELTFSIAAQGIIVTRAAYIIAVAAVFAVKYLRYRHKNKMQKGVK